MAKNRKHAASARAGHADPHRRLADMDADGVEVSSSYCEVSSFRYLYLIKHGWKEATRAFNSALARVRLRRSEAAGRLVPDPDPRHRRRGRRGAAGPRRSGASRCSCPVFPAELGLPDYWEQRYAPLWEAIQETDLPICCHIGMNTQLDDLARRDPTPQKGIFVPMVPLSAAEALGMWIMGGVFERFPRLKVVFVEPGLGWVSWWLYIVDDLMTAPGLRVPGDLEAAEPLLPPERLPHVHRRARRDPARPRTAGHRQHHVVVGLPASRCRAGRTPEHSSRRCSTEYRDTSASSSSAATPHASGTCRRVVVKRPPVADQSSSSKPFSAARRRSALATP